MAQRYSITVSPRTISGTGSLKRLRSSGVVPAVMYGRVTGNTNLQVNAKALSEVLHRATGENILVDLDIEGGGKQLALVQDVDHNTLSNTILHVDFHAISETEKIHAKVPLHLTGEEIITKGGAVLEHQIHKLEVSCLPKDLPDTIEVDVSELGIGKSLHVSDIKLAAGVHAKLGGHVIVAILMQPRVAEVAPAAEEAAGKPAAKKAAAKKAAAPAPAPAAKK